MSARPPIRIGLIGCGAAGAALGRAISRGEAGRCLLAAVLVRTPSRLDPALVSELGCQVYSDPEAFFGSGLDLVVEAAGHDALRAYAQRALGSGADLLVISVGAFADADLEQRVRSAAAQSGKRVLLATGAIAGLDAIAAGAVGGLDAVTHSIRKPPRGLLAPDEAAAVEASGIPRELYKGPAREAAKRFPENVNVAAAISLAGLGLDRTMVRVVADPTVVRNTHEIEARGHFGELRIVLQNIPTENPKTGRLTAMSLVKAVRNLTETWVVGA
ncbi:MAG: aspartate dehydrogenase [Chloroflexota bacterium]